MGADFVGPAVHTGHHSGFQEEIDGEAIEARQGRRQETA
jgi:hypothetical protein